MSDEQAVSIDELPPEARERFALFGEAFRRNHDLCRAAVDLMRRGEPVEVAVGHLPVEAAEVIKDALTVQCVAVLGLPPTWTQTAEVWTLHPPKPPATEVDESN